MRLKLTPRPPLEDIQITTGKALAIVLGTILFTIVFWCVVIALFAVSKSNY